MPTQTPEEQKQKKGSESSAPSAEGPMSLEIATWKKIVSEYEKPSLARSVWQLVTTLSLYFITWFLIYLNFKNEGPWYMFLPLVILGAGLVVRIFIIFHDCGHNSFFKGNYLFKTWTDAEAIIDYLVFAKNFIKPCIKPSIKLSIIIPSI